MQGTILIAILSSGGVLAAVSLCPSAQICLNGGRCSSHSASLASHQQDGARLFSCWCPPGFGLKTCQPTKLSRTTRVEAGEDLIVEVEDGSVAVVDHVELDQTKGGRDLLPYLVYWCQGGGGCSIPSSLLHSFTSSGFSVRWHVEREFSTREIPCPNHNLNHNTRKFIPSESTCYMKTTVTGSWEEARSQCQAWGGELAFPLPATNSTPYSWIQDKEEVWLAGSGPHQARPALLPDSQDFQPGVFKACFSDLWRCSDRPRPASCLADTAGQCNRSLRGLCALPPQRAPWPSPRCSATRSAGIDWPVTEPGHVARRSCPGPHRQPVSAGHPLVLGGGVQPAAFWACGASGAWQEDGPDLRECTTLRSVLEQSADPVEALEQVQQRKESIGTGDISILLDFIQNTTATKRNSSDVYLDKSVATISTLITAPELWLGLPKPSLRNQVGRLQDTVDQLADQLLTSNQSTHKESAVKLVVSDLGSNSEVSFHDAGSSISIKVHKRKGLGEAASNSTLGAKKPDKSGGVEKVVFKSFENLGCILNRQVSCSEPTLQQTRQVNSRILGANLGSEPGAGEPVHVSITFHHIYSGDRYNLSSARCVYWNTSNRDWDTAGCTTQSSCASHTSCACDHLTNFAVIMDIAGIIKKSALAPLLHQITVVCLPLSLLCLFLSLLVFTVVPGLRSLRNSIHIHLTLSLFLAQTLTISAIQATDPAILCTLVAIALHFLYLSSFSWMLLEGWHVYSLLVDVFQRKQIGLLAYCGFGYGVPTLIVLVSFLVSHLLELKGYGGESFCWLNTQNGFIWAFGGPVALTLLANLAIFSMAMMVSRRAINRNSKMDQKDKFLTWVKGSTSLISILGLSWAFGFLYSYQGSDWMAVIFTLLNSLQGVFIFLMHVVLNLKVRKKTKEYLLRQYKNVEYTTSHSRTSTRRRPKKLDRNETGISIVDLNLNTTSTVSETTTIEASSALDLKSNSTIPSESTTPPPDQSVRHTEVVQHHQDSKNR